VANDDFGREYWHFDDIVNYVNDDEAYSIDSDNQINWNDYYNRPGVMDDSWNAYLKYGGLLYSNLLIITCCFFKF